MQTILHLTDIHFGWEGKEPSGHADRKLCLDGMLAELKKLEPPWKPTIICISGDIAWHGYESEYAEARNWLDELLEVCGLTYKQMIVCAGNHDVIRTTAEKLSRPESSKDADKVLSPPIAKHFEEPFTQFISFCNQVEMPIMKFGESESRLVGMRTINKIRFIVLNSSWFSKDDFDEGKLWIGLPHLKYMESHSDLQLLEDKPSAPLTIALFHHPAEMLNKDERHTSGLRQNTYDYFAHRSHIMLTGHTHDAVRRADRIAEGALNFTGGSAYAGAAHFNTIRLIQIAGDKVIDRSFEFDPRSVENKWRAHEAFTQYLVIERDRERNLFQVEAAFSTQEYRNSFRNDAVRHLEIKSRLLRQTGILPAIVRRPVAVRISVQRNQYDRAGRLIREKHTEHEMPFYDAVRESRRTLLLGDLGTGKSTLAAQLVTETIDRSANAVAVFVPVKSLRCSGQFTPRDLLNYIDDYVANAVWLKTPKFNLSSMLDRGIEVLLVLDGLDELARDVAARLLRHSAALVENWPTIQVVSTARPVELVGVSYADWRIVHTVALDDTSKSDFIREELIAEGVPTEQLHERTSVLLRSLKDMTSLDSIANSPLSIRLIYQHLKSLSSVAQLTLGDLLYDLLIERLDGWQKRDDKPSAYLHFDKIFPTPEQKGLFLSILAEKAVTKRQIGQEEAKTLLEERATTIPGANSYQLAEEAISFYEWLGLLTKAESIEFPLQPLAEVCAAMGYLSRWINSHDSKPLPDREVWRPISFVAAIAKRRGLFPKIRERLNAYIDALMNEHGYLPAACYIVAEAADTALASHTVCQIDDLGYRPLTFFQNERKASARNIAKTLALAGETGFEWFFKDYLDPRYPIPNAGSAIVKEVFAEWAALVRATLTSAQKEKLARLVSPYQATGEGNFFGVLTILSVLVPEAFLHEDRFWYQSLAMDDGLFTEWVKEQLLLAKGAEDSAKIIDALLLQRSSESARAARLWLDWNPKVDPPYSIIRQALRTTSKQEVVADEGEILAQCRERLGDRWMRFARWALATEDATVAAGAAKVLYDAGERRLSVLGGALMKAMHDGGYIASAEKILSALVLHGGDSGVHWLASRISHAEEPHGAHSGWWRLLLERIETIENGPELLARCTRSLGQYILPRHPEVREGFVRVLKGPKGKIFRNALRNRLKSLDPYARRGAAAILVSADPQTEAEALFVSIRSRAQSHSFDWHEWESFCLTLDFGPSVLASLRSKLNLLEPQSRALALIVLQKGGVELDHAYRKELMASLLSLGNWHLCREPSGQALIAAEASFEFLLGQIDQPKLDSASRAAEHLMEFHRARLTPINEAKCIALQQSTSFSWQLVNNMNRVARDPEFGRRLIEVGREICEKGGTPPILALVAQAISEKAKWKDVVWSLLCDDTRVGGISEGESGGMALLEFGLMAEQRRASIGQAAKECMADPRVKQNRWHDVYHWLALLSDEFGGLDENTVRDAILHGRPIHYSATTALIGRLGEVPEGFSCDRKYRHRPATSIGQVSNDRDSAKVILQLKDCARDSNEVHPALPAILQDCLFLDALDEQSLSSISTVGKTGILITTILRFIYGQQPKMAETVPLLDVWSKIWSDRDSNKPHLRELTRMWAILRESAIFDDPDSGQAYLAALDASLLNTDLWKLPIAWDILEIRGSLIDAQIPLLFADYAKHRTFLHEVLFFHLCKWLSGDLIDSTKEVAVKSAENAILVLNETPWFPNKGEVPNTWAELLFPSVLWAHSGKSSESSEAVFLRGIRSIFEKLLSPHDVARTDLSKLLSMLDPMLAKVPPEILRQVLQRGAESLEPSISAFCRLIGAFSKLSPE
ncbi:MAG: metallophosphoesterase [Syntrophobacterales bacterium]|nr:metallophosphoesterase [Syntrophobacterales bacterium]